MKLLILGGTGMLGQALRRVADREAEVYSIARAGADFCFDACNGSLLEDAIDRIQPRVIVNAAAVTDLNACERDLGTAYQINARLVSVLAEICRSRSIYLVQISTDHFFTGDGNAPHAENAPVHLVNDYARTKYAGECFALTYPGALVVRTNIVGFRRWAGRPTFVEWALNQFTNPSSLACFTDYFTSSIDVDQFSSALLNVIRKRPSGLLNLASREVFSKKRFLHALAEKWGVSLVGAHDASVTSLAGARRAESVGLDVSRAEKLLGYPLPDLQKVIDSLYAYWAENRNAVQDLH